MLTIYPVVARKRMQDYTRPKAANRIQRSTGKVHGSQLADEERQTDANGSNKGGLVFLGGEHEDGEDELGGAEHLDEESL